MKCDTAGVILKKHLKSEAVIERKWPCYRAGRRQQDPFRKDETINRRVRRQIKRTLTAEKREWGME